MIMQRFSFIGTVIEIGTTHLIRIPADVSKEFSTRGMCMIEGKIGDTDIHCPLEPDGEGGHWLKIRAQMLQLESVTAGDSLKVEMAESKNWYDPELPEDFDNALNAEKQLRSTWDKLTSRAKWEWMRWIGGTRNKDTRAKRISTAMDKLRKGDKRPCCFNSTMCTDITVSKSGVLMASALPK